MLLRTNCKVVGCNTPSRTGQKRLAVAEFIDPVRELKPALKWGYSGVKVGLKGGKTHTPFYPTLKLALPPGQDLWIRLQESTDSIYSIGQQSLYMESTSIVYTETVIQKRNKYTEGDTSEIHSLLCRYKCNNNQQYKSYITIGDCKTGNRFVGMFWS